MTTLAAPTGNEIQDELAASYTRGTDTTITLDDGASFVNSTPLGHVVRINSGSKWCLVIYDNKTDVDTLEMSAVDDYALAVNLGGGAAVDEVFPIGSTVELVCAADEIAQVMDSEATAIHDNIAGEIVAVTEKTAPIAADKFLIEDSAASDAKKSLKLGYLPTHEWLRLPGETVERVIIGKYMATTKENKTIYVRSNGVDTQDGSANTSGAALLTIQKAVDIVSKLAIAHDIIIQVTDEDGDGTNTFDEMVSIGPLIIPGGSLTIQGDTTTPSNCIIDGGSARTYGFVIDDSVLTIKGFEINNCTAAGIRVSAPSSYVELTNCKLDDNARGLKVSAATVIIKNLAAPVCTLNVNTYYGIEIDSGGNVRCLSADISGNGDQGVRVTVGSFAFVKDCSIDSNTNQGVYVASGSTAWVRDCTSAVGANGSYGVQAVICGIAFVDAAASDNITGSTAAYIPTTKDTDTAPVDLSIVYYY